ncbi:MAG: zinc-binding dehydrogenase [Chloroflexi bacterium]|nr:zinc-binding dehydrogenase [Chloroflexota bacterium]
MKAVYIEAHGGPEALVYGERPDPVIKDHEVKVKVGASALNRLDLYTREGGRGLRREFPPPLILGGDCAGEVVEVGGAVIGLNIGDRVVVNPLIDSTQLAAYPPGAAAPPPQFLGSAVDGSYAEYVAVPAANAHPIVEAVSYETAAAAPTTFLPVWNMMVRRAKLKPWETVLVLSASAGVGTAAIQVAKKVVGARVIATTSTEEKVSQAKSLGADEVINYKEEDIGERVKAITGGQGVDVVVDHVGAEFFTAAFNALRPGGRYTICGATTGLRAELHLGLLFTKQIEIYGGFMGTNEDMREIVAMLNRGVIQPVVHQVFPLAEAAAAHQAMEATNFFGKILLRP